MQYCIECTGHDTILPFPSILSTICHRQTFSVSSQSINDGEHSAFAEWADSCVETLSAEGIALSLISKFKQVEMPKAVDLVQSLSDQVSSLHRVCCVICVCVFFLSSLEFCHRLLAKPIRLFRRLI